MQYINYDMEELMRRAAEHNPVQPKGADWNAVLQQLKEGDKPAVEKTKWNNNKRYFLLLTFLLASLVCNRFYNVYHPFGTSADVMVDKTTNENEKVSLTQQNAGENWSSETTVADKGTATGRQQRVFKNLESTFRTIAQNDNHPQPVPTASREEEKYLNTTTQHKVIVAENNPIHLPTNKEAATAEATNTEKTKSKNESLDEISAAAKTIKLKKPQKFYASLLAGPDITTIKLQKIKGTGYSLGLMLGYKFRKAWAVEAGALWDRKKYYSEGAYFKTEKIYLPPHSEILEVEGYCDMVEIPINIRYNFKQGHKGDWFAVSGVSSYLMQKEDYDYVYKRYNTQYNSSKYYTKASKEWFSVLNLGVGYEHTVGKAGKLRVEPYVKVPLSGMGVGDMPLTSTGIYVGFTRPIR